MQHSWQAERTTSPEEALARIRARFPDLGARSAQPMGEGWDNTAFLVDGRWVFRFPRRQIAVPLLEREARVLPRLASLLPLPIPAPRWFAPAGPGSEWPFAGYPLLDGVTADRAALPDEERMAVAPSLGRFLAALHAIPVDGLNLPRDELARTDFVQRRPRLEARLKEVAAAGVIDRPERVLDLFRGEPAGPPPRPVLVHGDLYSRHLLVAPDRALAGVIDWGDVHAGDPGLDLMAVYSFLPPAARPLFFRVYGPADARTLRVARLRAAYHTVVLLGFAHETGDEALLREARTGLRNVLAE
ncbi:MAG TPA: phosphotransferase [Longimicrobium sp.]|jgi:aminoglycoside phosphotransferase (APT) family kinase protein|uniref:phosphotransferase n=1 Tax=Longimicrobium sp. TaxID=2029185 RepID=UPI002EDB4152